MKRPTDRRTVLKTAAVAAMAAATGSSVAQSADIRGSITYEGGVAIPEGRVEIYLEDTAVQGQAQRRAAETSVESDGGSKSIEFSLSPPAGLAGSQTQQVVARLERADGWLLARGSAQFEAGLPVQVTLNTVVY